MLMRHLNDSPMIMQVSPKLIKWGTDHGSDLESFLIDNVICRQNHNHVEYKVWDPIDADDEGGLFVDVWNYEWDSCECLKRDWVAYAYEEKQTKVDESVIVWDNFVLSDKGWLDLVFLFLKEVFHLLRKNC